MNTPYLCPSCKSNRTRFAIVDQAPVYVKLNPESGEAVQYYEQDELDLFHMPYRGSVRRVQCGVCGLIEDEQTFVTMARNHPRRV
ncbi:hypothetical protein [Aneurinibacillus tyrosinisolvens]|uniref:hypothetical protein n=1 Tax=Aneurinibacillus tyrosinisolvens TaxID=1443435 RepID=UPI00063FCB47|nr:hypothetical protein [Aneurinibacillus tyrosinisolvens]